MPTFDELLSLREQQAPNLATGSPEPTEFDSLIQQREQEQGRLRAATWQATQTTPEKAAQQQHLSSVTGLPLGFVQTDEGHAKAVAKFQEISKLAESSPVLKARLLDPNFIAIAQDDTDTLGAIGGALVSTAKYIVSAPGQEQGLLRDIAATPYQTMQGVEGLSRMLWATGAATVGAGEDSFLRKGEKSAADSATYFGNRAKEIGSKWEPGSIFGAGASSGVTSAAQTIPTGVALSYLLGPEVGIPATLISMALNQAGASYQKAREKGLGHWQSTAYGIEDGVAEFVGEKFLGAGGFLKNAMAGASAKKLLMYEVTREMPGEMGTTLWQNFNEWHNLNPDKKLGEFLAEQPEALAQTAVSVLVGGGAQTGLFKMIGGAVTQATEEQAKSQQAEQSLQHLGQIMALASQSKLRERSPQTFAEVSQEMADKTEGAPTEVRFDARTLGEVLNQEELAMLPSIASQMEEALATGGEVSVPIGELMANAAGTPLEQKLTEHARVGDNELSAFEAKEAAAQAETYLQDEAKRVIAEATDSVGTQASHDKVKQTVLDQLTTLGRFTKDVNEANATISASMYTALASRLGMTPEQVYEKYPLRVDGVNPATQGDVLNTVDQTQAEHPAIKNFQGLNLRKSSADVNVSAASAFADRPFTIQPGVREVPFSDFTLQDSTELGSEQSKARIEALAAAIAKNKAIEPLFIAQRADGSRYLAEGQHRARALQALGYTSVPARVMVESGTNPTILSQNIYHGTTADAAAAIEKEGFDLTKAADGTVWFTSNKNIGEVAASGKGGVVSRTIDSSTLKLGTWAEADKYSTDELIAQGYDGLKLEDGGETTYQIFNPEKLGKENAAIGNNGNFDPNDANILRQSSQERSAIAPLEGAPAHGPDPQLVSVAEQYALDSGIDLKRQAEYVKIDPAFSKRIAEAYEAMPHDPQNPEVQAAYADLIAQTRAQYDALDKAGYSFTFFDSNSDPYAGNPMNAMRDLRANKTMAVYGTYDGFGSSALDVSANPLLASTGLQWPDQKGELHDVSANDLFRAVHDAFGHGLEGAGFRAQGEENAWQAHSRMFTGLAVGAMTTETRGQNSWLNYGPHGEQNRTAKVEDTIFADQKTGLMPEWTWTEGRAGDMPRDVQEQTEQRKMRQAVDLLVLQKDDTLDQKGEGTGALDLTGVHFSKESRTTLDGRFYGSGLKGAERDRVNHANDYRLRSRLYFYVDEGKGVRSEAGVGGNAHEAQIENVYDIKADPLKLVTNGDLNQTETNILNAGFNGYYVSDAFNGQGAAVLLGEASHGVASSPISNPNQPLPSSQTAQPYKRGLSSKELNSVNLEEVQKVAPSAQIKAGTFQVAQHELAAAQQAMADQGIPLPNANTLSSSNARGTFNPKTLTISLLEGADLSTFHHEMAHFYLEVLTHIASQENAPASISNDVDVLLKWFKVKDLDTWNKMTLAQKRDNHEKFAEHFEHYLFEGKSPNMEMQQLFQRFASWMKSVYKSLSDFMASHNTQLTDEVRGVYDRMLATEAQIVEAEAARKFAPLFKSAEEVGMSPTEWAQYQTAANGATEDAIENLQKRSLRDLKWAVSAKNKAVKTATKDVEEKRKTTEAEVRAEVEAMPVYAAKAALDKIEGKPTDADIQMVSEWFNYGSPDEMLQEMADAQPIKHVIEGMTDQRLLERYGDLTTPQGIERAANEAVHNEARAKFVATELKALSEGVRLKTPDRTTILEKLKECLAT